MSIELQLSSVFARYAGNQTILTVKGSTVAECLEDLFNQFPELRKIFLDKDGNLLRAYDIYINGASAYPEEMTKPVKDGDKLHIIPSYTGDNNSFNDRIRLWKEKQESAPVFPRRTIPTRPQWNQPAPDPNIFSA